MKNHLLPVCLLFAAFVRPAEAAMMITEFMYQGQDTAQTEFVEFTNVGSTPIDMTGWSFDDDSNEPGSLDLSGFGIVEPWQSVVITDALAADFRALWNLDSSVKIIGESDEGLARNDIMYLYKPAMLRWMCWPMAIRISRGAPAHDSQGSPPTRRTMGRMTFPNGTPPRWRTASVSFRMPVTSAAPVSRWCRNLLLS